VEEIVGPDNLERARRKAKANVGARSPDGITLKAFPKHFQGLVFCFSDFAGANLLLCGESPSAGPHIRWRARGSREVIPYPGLGGPIPTLPCTVQVRRTTALPYLRLRRGPANEFQNRRHRFLGLTVARANHVRAE